MGLTGRVLHFSPVGGGCINRAVRLEGAGERFFVKLNRAELLPMFVAEADGLAALGKCNAIRVPTPLAHGSAGEHAFLLLEWIDLLPARAGDERRLGESLAELHRHLGGQYGWHCDNTIGSTAQANGAEVDWSLFFIRKRLHPQLALARSNRLSSTLLERGARLLELLPDHLARHQPPASLLHGDFWGGNHGFDHLGCPVLFDPAVYYGDRETDVAMSELFGAFSPTFYAAYRSNWPLDAGYPIRRQLYNLYHLLNHANLFAGSYVRQSEATIDRLLAELL